MATAIPVWGVWRWGRTRSSRRHRRRRHKRRPERAAQRGEFHDTFRSRIHWQLRQRDRAPDLARRECLQRGEEALHRRIIPAIARTAHRRGDGVIGHQPLVLIFDERDLCADVTADLMLLAAFQII
jgi:hypothetical protein